MKMGEDQCTDQSSVVTSSLTLTNWWDLHHHASTNDFSAWHHHEQNPNSNNSSSDQDQDVSISTTSFTNVSNHSGLTVEESSAARQLVHHETTSNSQLWRQVLLMGNGNNGEVHNGHDVRENLLESLSSKSMSTNGIFDQPACDYLKKMDNSNWEFTSSTFNNFDKHHHHLNRFNTHHHNEDHHHQNLLIHNENESLSNLVSNWSLAPPDPDINNHQFDSKLDCSLDDHHHNQYLSHKQIFNPLMSRAGILLNDLKMESDHQHHDHQENNIKVEGSRSLFQRSLINTNGYNHQYQIGVNSSPSTIVGDNSKLLLHGILDSGARNNLNFTSRFTKPLLDINVSKPLSSSDPKKPTSSITRNNGRGHLGANDQLGKKKRRDNQTIAETSAPKKPKQDSSNASSLKAPKVKLTDRITTLQQIVSPFGKTDTASVLYEAIQYIKFLQEQVQLFSNPYLKTNPHKDPWGSLARKEQGSLNDLRSRGLCLVPISCTPQSYRENNGSDYWTPAYRGCLYR